MYQTILFEIHDQVGILTLNRPEILNAITETMLREMHTVCQEIAARKQIRALIITGNGRAFCAGADLEAAVETLNLDYGEVLQETYNPLIQAIHELPVPVIAGINGPAVGAGLSLALACDLRIADSTASFSQAFINIGLVPDAGSSYFLPRIVGLSKALELSLLGHKLSATEAKEIGLVNQVVETEKFHATVLQLANRLAAMPTKAIGLMKESLYRSYDSTLEEALQFEAKAQSQAGKTADHLEGVRAFLEKRKPHFRGN